MDVNTISELVHLMDSYKDLAQIVDKGIVSKRLTIYSSNSTCFDLSNEQMSWFKEGVNNKINEIESQIAEALK